MCAHRFRSFSFAQAEKAFQKQEGARIFAVKRLGAKRAGTGRYYKNIGLGFKTPSEAISGTYVDNKCPFTGSISIRGRILSGIVASTKMKNTITIRRDYLHFIKKYNRYEKRHVKISAHCSPCFRVEEGDIVTIGQCRPLSKTVRFNVIRIDRKASSGSKQFAKF